MSFRLVGDNINWTTKVNDERKNRHGHMNHAFGSAALVSAPKFADVNFDPTPALEFNADVCLPTDADFNNLKELFAKLVSTILVQHVPALRCLDLLANSNINIHGSELCTKTTVIPLQVEFKNEQKNEDVIDILGGYEDLAREVYAGHDIPNIHVGGDLLTRERFSSAKRLRATATKPEEKFVHLTPITFEMFHLQMKFLTYMFKQLYNKASGTSSCSMFAAKVNLNRNSVTEDVKSNFDACRDFAVSFCNAYVVDAALDFFGMDDTLSTPSLHRPYQFDSEAEQFAWSRDVIGRLVDKFVLNGFRAYLKQDVARGILH